MAGLRATQVARPSVLREGRGQGAAQHGTTRAALDAESVTTPKCRASASGASRKRRRPAFQHDGPLFHDERAIGVRERESIVAVRAAMRHRFAGCRR